MYDPGYKDYGDPRLQPPEEEERDCCGTCAYYRDVARTQSANGLKHCVGVCVLEVFQADTFAELDRADVESTDPGEEPCENYREEK